MRWIFAILLTTLFTGCANLQLDEVAATGATAGTALVTTAVGLPPAVVLTTSATAGLATSAITPPSGGPGVDDYRGEDGELSFPEALALMWANFTNHLIGLGIVFGIFFFLWTYLGMRWKRPEEKAMEKQVSLLVDKIGSMKDR